jgi:hypothetical protein
MDKGLYSGCLACPRHVGLSVLQSWPCQGIVGDENDISFGAEAEVVIPVLVCIKLKEKPEQLACSDD